MTTVIEAVYALSFRPPYYGQILDGKKTLETRKWRPRVAKPPFKLLICSTKLAGQSGQALGLVVVEGWRRMTAEDEAAACFPFDPLEKRYVWDIRLLGRLAKPFPVVGKQSIFVVTIDDSQLAILPTP